MDTLLPDAPSPAEYDKWLKAKVRAAMASTGPLYSHESVMAEMQELIEAKLREHASRSVES